MACQLCWAMPQPPVKHNYLLVLMDAQTHRIGRCVMQSECAHGMQEWVTHLASTNGGLVVVVPTNDEKFSMTSPLVMDIDDKAARHIPVVDPVN